jgi:hypothetical protein
MARPKRPTSRTARDGHAEALGRLRAALGLDDADWKEFQQLALDGFADYQSDVLYDPWVPDRLRDVPLEWFEDPEILGYVAVRALKFGTPGLAAPVARFFLGICDPGPNEWAGPPGIGLAWLRLARLGITPPVAPARLAELALTIPRDYFQGVEPDDLLPLSRLILENRRPLVAFDLHALVDAVASSRIHARAPFRLFDDLMSSDWIPAEVRREFARGVLECSPEARRIQEAGAAANAAFHLHDDNVTIPRFYLELRAGGVGRFHPGLKRHAVLALVENLGEPLRDVIAEFYLKRFGDQQSTNAVSEGVLDLIRLHAEELGPDEVKRLLRKALRGRYAALRLAAYRLGAALFGAAFARPARNDPARLVRDWAEKSLSESRPRRGPRSRSKPIPRSGASPEE